MTSSRSLTTTWATASTRCRWWRKAGTCYSAGIRRSVLRFTGLTSTWQRRSTKPSQTHRTWRRTDSDGPNQWRLFRATTTTTSPSADASFLKPPSTTKSAATVVTLSPMLRWHFLKFIQKKSRKTRHSLFSKVNPMSKNLLVLGDEEKKRKFERFLIMNHFLFVFWVKDRTRKKPFLPSFCWIWSFIFIYKMSWCQLVVLLTWFDKSCPFQYLSVAFKYFRCFPDKLFYSNLSPCWASFKPVLFGIGWWMIHDQAPHIIFAPRFVRTIK